jgi:hypothetical protein
MFNRGISEEFVQALRKWRHWEEIVNDNHLFMAIRDRYVNIYYQGCSIFKISHKNGQLTPETHYKYLVSPNVQNPYVLWKDDRPAVEDRVDEILIHAFDLASLKKSSSVYAGDEKEGVHDILMSNRNIVDVEVALSPEAEAEEAAEARKGKLRRVADRIDFAAIQKKDGKVWIVFFEAKRFDNSELRSRKHEPAVFEQIGRYEAFIKNNRLEMETSYRSVCKNMAELLRANRYDPLVKEAAESPEKLAVDPDVRLVIFGYDADQEGGEVWKEHKEALSKHFQGRLLMKGSPGGFINGISKYGSDIAA